MWCTYDIVGKSQLEKRLESLHHIFDKYRSPIRVERACRASKKVPDEYGIEQEEPFFAMLVFDSVFADYQAWRNRLEARGWKVGTPYPREMLTPETLALIRRDYGRPVFVPARNKMDGRPMPDALSQLQEQKRLDRFCHKKLGDEGLAEIDGTGKLLLQRWNEGAMND
jgi:hypothetical protein